MIAEKIHLTPAEYLALERQSEERHEYHGGELRMMAGASRKHNIISGNLFAFFHQQLRGKPCRPFMNAMRVWIASALRYFYPDVAVICGTEAFVEKILPPMQRSLLRCFPIPQKPLTEVKSLSPINACRRFKIMCWSPKTISALNISTNSLKTNGDTLP